MTGVELVVPNETEALDVVAERVRVAVATAGAVEVRSQSEAVSATEIVAQIAQQKRDAERERKELVGPLNAHVKLINGKFKEFTEPLEAADKVVRAKLGTYQAEQERLRRAEEERLEAERQERERKAREERERQEAEVRAKREAAERAAREAEQAAETKRSKEAERLAEQAAAVLDEAKVAETAVKSLPTFEVPKAVVPEAAPLKSDSGAISTRKVWRFEITAPALVPREYLVVDEKAIREAVRDGVRDIPGVRITQESEMAVRTA